MVTERLKFSSSRPGLGAVLIRGELSWGTLLAGEGGCSRRAGAPCSLPPSPLRCGLDVSPSKAKVTERRLRGWEAAECGREFQKRRGTGGHEVQREWGRGGRPPSVLNPYREKLLVLSQALIRVDSWIFKACHRPCANGDTSLLSPQIVLMPLGFQPCWGAAARPRGNTGRAVWGHRPSSLRHLRSAFAFGLEIRLCSARALYS